MCPYTQIKSKIITQVSWWKLNKNTHNNKNKIEHNKKFCAQNVNADSL